MRNTLHKTERLKSRKQIESLFREGKSFSVFPFKIFYLTAPAPAPTSANPVLINPSSLSQATPTPGHPSPPPGHPSPLQAGFGVSSRLFPKAVDRNRIKRLTREAWRLQRHPLSDHLGKKGLSLAVFLLYTGKQLPDYPLVTKKIGVALQKLVKEI